MGGYLTCGSVGHQGTLTLQPQLCDFIMLPPLILRMCREGAGGTSTPIPDPMMTGSTVPTLLNLGTTSSAGLDAGFKVTDREELPVQQPLADTRT